MDKTKTRGALNDDFQVRIVEGGFLLIIESTQPNDCSAIDELPPMVPQVIREQLKKSTRRRTIVAKALSEVIVHLREWAGVDDVVT